VLNLTYVTTQATEHADVTLLGWSPKGSVLFAAKHYWCLRTTEITHAPHNSQRCYMTWCQHVTFVTLCHCHCCRLCQLTFCVINNPALEVSPKPFTAAVLNRLQNPDLVSSARPYDLVMLLRHMCMLNPEPPQGLEQGLMPLVVSKMPKMSMQELSMLLHVAIEWQLGCQQQLAEAVAALVAAALGVPLQQQQQQQHEAAAAAEQHDASSSMLAASQASEQQQQHEGHTSSSSSSSSSSSNTAASLYPTMQQAVAAVQQKAARKQQQQQQQQQHGRTRQAPLTAADPVILLHRFKQCGYHPPKPLLLPLLRAVGPRVHQISLLQAGLLSRAIEVDWRDAEGCKELLDAGLGRWMVGITTPSAAAAAAVKMSEASSKVVAGGGDLGTGSSSSRSAVVSKRVFELPYWQLKSLIVAAGRFGPLEAEAAAAAAAGTSAQQQQWDGQGSIARAFISGLLDKLSESAPLPAAAQVSSSSSRFFSITASSSSSRPTGSGGSSSKASWQATPSVLSEWRADMVLALFWAAARLGISPEPQLLQQGCDVLTARMHRQVKLVLVVICKASCKLFCGCPASASCACVAIVSCKAVCRKLCSASPCVSHLLCIYCHQ
jgi:hypothetical protein